MNAIFIGLMLFSYSQLSFGQSIVGSADVLEFSENGVLFIGDSKNSAIHAFDLSSVNPVPSVDDIQLEGMEDKIGQFLNLDKADHHFLVKDMVVHPISQEVYMALSFIQGVAYQHSVVVVSPQGEISLVDLTQEHEVFQLADAYDKDFDLYQGQSIQQYNITDLDFHQGKLYISGLSNASFASTLRMVDYPFDKSSYSVSTVEIYHAIHAQIETRAPIRTMDIITLDGEDYILAAYTCTPLVVIPLKELSPGAHLVGKTIAELGYGNTPVDLISLRSESTDENAILLTNKNRNAMVLSYQEIKEGVAKEGLSKNLGLAQKTGGVPFEDFPIVNALAAAAYSKDKVVVIYRNTLTGALAMITEVVDSSKN